VNIDWLTKRRSFGKSSFSHSVGFFILVSIVVAVALHMRGVDIEERIESAFVYYIGPILPPSKPLQSVDTSDVSDAVMQVPVQEPVLSSPKSERPQSQAQQMIPPREVSAIPRIALYTLSDAQYSESSSNGMEMAELVSAMLMASLGKNDHFELLDRTVVSALFDEKSLLLASDQSGSELTKLMLSDYTLVGSLFSTENGDAFSLKLVKNSSGEVLDAFRFHFTLETLGSVVREAGVFVENALQASRQVADGDRKNIIAFGHFVNISTDDSQINQGWDITERLITRYVREKGYSVLSRTQTFPLLFEEYLRFLQYTDEDQQSLRQNARYLVYGYYRIDYDRAENPITLYLYLDTIKYGRELKIIKAENWDAVVAEIGRAIENFIPGTGYQISKEKKIASIQRFLDAMNTRGGHKTKNTNTSRESFSANDYRVFLSNYKTDEIIQARKFIEQSLELNPYNQQSKFALAKLFEVEGDDLTSNRLLSEVSRSPEESVASEAYQILINKKNKRLSNFSTEDLSSIKGIESTDGIVKELINDKYITKRGERFVFNGGFVSDQVFNQPYQQTLTGVEDEIGVQVFEKLRDLYYRPGDQVKYHKPRRFHSIDRKTRRDWYQSVYSDKHNAEAVLQLDMAHAASGLYINDAADLPTVEFGKEVEKGSLERRASNLEVTVDALSSSAFLDTTYLKAKVLLGHALCRKEIGRCGAGKAILNWVVDHTHGANLQGRGGIYFNVAKEVEEKDRLLFLAADVVNRVAEADLTEMFEYTLQREAYYETKHRQRLAELQRKIGRIDSDNETDLLVDAYAEQIDLECARLSKQKLGLRHPLEFTKTIDAIGRFAEQSERAAGMLRKRLAESRAHYPDVYPYLLVHSNVRNSFMVGLQSEMIAKVAAGDVVPYQPDEFMTSAAQLFKMLVEDEAYGLARRYIDYFGDYYTLSEDNAIDFAYMYYLVGEPDISSRLMREYGKSTFRVNHFTRPGVDGSYESQGFNENGRLTYTSSENPKVYISYEPLRRYVNFGEHPAKWTLYTGRKSHPGNRNSKHPKLFAFGNGGHLTGEREWQVKEFAIDESTDLSVERTEPASEVENFDLIEVSPLNKDGLDGREISVEFLFNQGYTLSIDQRSAIKGFPEKATIGPLLDSYFPQSFSATRKVSVVREALFKKGYLSVSGVPLFQPGRELLERFDKDFPGFSDFEKRCMNGAFKKAAKVSGAGYVEVYQYDGTTWSHAATLLPDDAVENRNFGLATAIDNGRALVCDYKDGLYSYRQQADDWVLDRRIGARCKGLVMNGDWAVVASTEKLFVYRYTDGVWKRVQTLRPDDYQRRRGRREGFSFFGSALTMNGDTLLVGNPYGGEGSRGEVYLFTLRDGQWQQSDLLLTGDSVGGYGASISMQGNYFAIGNPSYSGEDEHYFNSGTVLLYERNSSQWQLNKRLVPAGRNKGEAFGERVCLIRDQPGLLVRSNDNLYNFQQLRTLSK
jgi:TolB-like protein